MSQSERNERIDVPAADDLEGEVDENGDGHVLLQETLLQQLERRDRVVRHEADLGNEMEDDEGLNVCKKRKISKHASRFGIGRRRTNASA